MYTIDVALSKLAMQYCMYSTEIFSKALKKTRYVIKNKTMKSPL